MAKIPIEYMSLNFNLFKTFVCWNLFWFHGIQIQLLWLNCGPRNPNCSRGNIVFFLNLAFWYLHQTFFAPTDVCMFFFTFTQMSPPEPPPLHVPRRRPLGTARVACSRPTSSWRPCKQALLAPPYRQRWLV